MYATKADIERIYGVELLTIISDLDENGRVDDLAVTAALETATSEIDSYVGGRYVVPLDPIPTYIRQCCVDIAVYRLAHSEAPRTAEMRLRYEDAMRYLRDVAKGTVAIQGADDLPAGDGNGSDVGSTARILNLKRA